MWYIAGVARVLSETVKARIDAELRELLKLRAEAEGRSEGAVIRIALAEHLNRKAER